MRSDSRFVHTLVVLTLAFALAACGDDESDDTIDGGADGAVAFPEVCDNTVDDDLDGAVDCDDSDCRAPDLATGEVEFAESVRFLWEGSSAGRCPGGPVQEGVEEGALRDDTVAVVRGRVVAAGGSVPIASARVAVAGAAELGSVRTDGAGLFTLAVRGGGAVTIEVRSDAYLLVQRTLAAPPGRWSWAGSIALTPRDTASTRIAFGSDAAQVHRGSEVRDDSGARRATLVFPAGVEATLRTASGIEAASSLTIRATEYTVGATGPEAMPGTLPAATAYTYAVEIDADEVRDPFTRIELSRPVSLLVENFLHFPVGTPVPLGYYDRALHRWVAERDGLVIAIVGVGPRASS